MVRWCSIFASISKVIKKKVLINLSDSVIVISDVPINTSKSSGMLRPECLHLFFH